MLEITPDLQQRIEAHVGGVFSQRSEVIRAALDIFEERQQEYGQLDTAIGQLQRGELTKLDVEDIKWRGRQRRF